MFADGWKYWLPIDASKQGYEVDRLITVIHWFMAVLFVGWGIFFVYCLVRFRARSGHKADPRPVTGKPSKYSEIAVAIFEVVLLLGFSMPVWARVKNQFPAREQSEIVHVVSEQFAWNFHYPGPDGKFGRRDAKFIDPGNPLGLDLDDPASGDDIVSVNNLHIPIGKPVIAEVMSKDVIHCFWIPVLRVKQDVIPGMSIPIWFEAARPGEYDISCAQLCGNNHFKMRGRVFIDTPEQYAAWQAEQRKAKQVKPGEGEFQL